MAEAILRQLGRGHFDSFSAGVGPAGSVNPHALETLEKHHVPSDGLAPKHLGTFKGQPFDYVITLCDRARERPPEFPGADVIHWTFSDPELNLDEPTNPRPFEQLFGGLAQRIRLLIAVCERSEREHPQEATPLSGTPTVG